MKKSFFLIVSILSVLFFSCQNPNQNTLPTKPGYTNLSLNLKKATTRTLSPISDVKLSDLDWTFEFTSTSNNLSPITKTATPEQLQNGSYNIQLPDGIYTISAKAQETKPVTITNTSGTDTETTQTVKLYGSITDVELSGNKTVSIPVGLIKTPEGAGNLFGIVHFDPKDTDGISYNYINNIKYTINLTSAFNSSKTYELNVSKNISDTAGNYYITLIFDNKDSNSTLIPIASGLYYLSIKVDYYSETDSPTKLHTTYLDLEDNVVEIADDLKTNFETYVNRSNCTKTYYATMKDSSYNGASPAYKVNLNTLLKKLTTEQNPEWQYANIYISEDEKSALYYSGIDIDSVYEYTNNEYSKITIKMGSKEYAVISASQTQPGRAVLSPIYATSPENDEIIYTIRPSATNSQMIISGSLPEDNNYVLNLTSNQDKYINFVYECTGDLDYYNLLPILKLNSAPLYYINHPVISISKTKETYSVEYNLEKTIRLCSDQDTTYQYQTIYDTINYAVLSSEDSLNYYIIPFKYDGNIGERVNQSSPDTSIPDYTVMYTYNSDKTTDLTDVSSTFVIKNKPVYFASNATSGTFDNNTTFIYQINDYILQDGYTNLQSSNAYKSDITNYITCIAINGNEIKSIVSSIGGVFNNNFVYNIIYPNYYFKNVSDKELTQDLAEIDSTETSAGTDLSKLKVCYDKHGNCWYTSYENGTSELKKESNTIVQINGDEKYIFGLSYDSEQDIVYYGTYNSTSITINKVSNASTSTSEGIEYNQFSYMLDDSSSAYEIVTSYITSENTTLIVKECTYNIDTSSYDYFKYYLVIVDNTNTSNIQKIHIDATDFASNETKLNFNDCIIKNNKLYILISEAYSNEDNWEYSGSWYRGGIFTLNLTNLPTTTINLKDVEVKGWSNKISQYAPINTDSGLLVNDVFVPDQSDIDSTTVLFGPQKFIAIKDDELVFTDYGVYLYDNDPDEKHIDYKHINRIITYTLEDESFSALPLDNQNFGTGYYFPSSYFTSN